MPSKETELTQAVIDESKDTIDKLLKDEAIKTWINNHVTVKSLHNHKLDGAVEWTTPICRACGLAPLATVRSLVEAGASLYDINSKGQTALIGTSFSTVDTLDKTKYLLDHDRKLLEGTDKEQFTCLHTAAQEGKVDICEYLIEQGADLKAGQFQGSTCLHTAAKYNRGDCVEFLLNHGADALARNTSKDTPLHSAAVGGACKTITCLLDHGVGVNTKGSYKRTAITHAAFYGQVKAVRLLLERGASVNQADETGVTPVYMAAWQGHEKVVNLLINEHDADVNAHTNNGWTPLHHACMAGQLSTVKALTSHPTCDMDITDNAGKTALDHASAKNHQHVTSFFINTRPLLRKMSLLERQLKDKQVPVSQDMGVLAITDDSKQTAAEVKKAVRKNMHWLVQNLSPMDHLDYLFSYEALSREDYENIYAERTDSAKTRRMILTLLDKPNASWAPVLLESLREECPHAADRLLQHK